MVMHADGAGTKSSLAYMCWAGDVSVEGYSPRRTHHECR